MPETGGDLTPDPREPASQPAKGAQGHQSESAHQSESDFFFELANSVEALRATLAQRIDAGKVSRDYRSGALELQYTLLQARKQAVSVASIKTAGPA